VTGVNNIGHLLKRLFSGFFLMGIVNKVGLKKKAAPFGAAKANF